MNRWPKKVAALSVGVMVLLIFCLASSWAAEQRMTYKEYLSQLAGYTDRESKATKQIAQLDKEIADLKRAISALDAEKATTEAEIYRLVQSNQAGVEAFMADLDGLIGRIRGLQRLSPDDLYKRKAEVEEIRAKLEALKKNPIAYLPEVADKISAIEGMLAQLEARIPRVPTPDEYTVVRGDNLWNISKKEAIYNDPYMWPRIYVANCRIKDSDLIQPDWVLTIPRGVGPNQHLVVRGEWLSKIAGYSKVYGDVSKWHELYQANKDQIADPDMIYPAQVLDVPRD
ncbi:MAG: LysM peptidoglycan-binding domain-containing protein [Candidatus Latescibacterota bacterium]